MKKIITILLSFFLVGLSPVFVMAQQNKNQAKDTKASNGQGYQVQNQNQVETKNMGEEQKLQVNTNEQESLQAGEVGSKSGYELKTESPRSLRAKQQMSNVAQKVAELLSTQGAKEGIGEQISEFAHQQKQAENQIAFFLDKLDSKSQLMKTFFGPDYGVVKNLKKQVEQNQERIKQLQQLQTQVQNKADESQLEETIQALVSFNNALQDRVQAEEKVKSIFGWFLKLFS